MDATDLYVLLGVSRQASEREIRQAYHSSAKRHHPDLRPNDEQSLRLMQLLNEAVAILGDPEKRAAYDQDLAAAAAQAAAASGAPSGPPVREGHDIHDRVVISAEEARQGALRTRTFHRPDGEPYLLQIVIPAGCQPNQRLVLRGAGSPGLNGGRPGDYIVQVVIG